MRAAVSVAVRKTPRTPQNKVLRRTNSVSIHICGFANELASDARYEVATVNAKQQNAAQHKQSAK